MDYSHIYREIRPGISRYVRSGRRISACKYAPGRITSRAMHRRRPLFGEHLPGAQRKPAYRTDYAHYVPAREAGPHKIVMEGLIG